MILELKKFGTTLISRQTGKEASLVFQPTLKEIKENENVEIDFSGILTFSHGWGDEFLTPLLNTFGNRLILKNTTNPSVQTTLDILEQSLGKHFIRGI